MASSVLLLLPLLAFALFLSTAHGEEAFTCEQLDRSTCAFAVSSSGVRCVLEKRVSGAGLEEYCCQSSGVEVAGIHSWIETDECVANCGLDRDTLGISSDSMLDKLFRRRLCSPECYSDCPNIVELFFNLAAGEGFFLPHLCESKGGRREMAEMNSSGDPEPACEDAPPPATSPA